ncbi:MAG: hypothetical protein LC121_08090 [Anaerolineae bacterium]|nr:hypothetical protein [Anaerolineae bacterium]
MTQGSSTPRPDPARRTPPPLLAASWSGRAGWRQRYTALRARASANSVMWWALQVVEGLVIGLGLALLGVVWLLVVGLAANLEWLGRLGIALIIGGVIVFVRYLAAPLTARWIVAVPPRWYYAVEDGQTTFEYLEPGRMIVPWRWNARAVPYVNFNSLQLSVRVENVLDSEELPVALDVALSMLFNPTYADESLYDTLRDYTRQEQFEALLADSVRDIVYEHLARLRLIGGDPVPLDVKTLESVIVEELAPYEAYGLVPAAERPVTVTVIAPPAVRDAYQAIWTQGAQTRSQSEILREIEHVADDLDVPFDEALQLFFLLQRGMPPPRSIRQTQTAAEVTPSAPPQPPAEAVPAEPPLAEQWVAPRAVDDPDYTPDPFALRRERKQQRRDARRSRRA